MYTTAGARTLVHPGKDSADTVLAVMLRRCKLVLLLYDAKRAVIAVIAAVRVVLLVLAVGVLIQTHRMQTGGAVPMASLVVTMRCVLIYTLYYSYHMLSTLQYVAVAL
jgi:hypothetical protein